MSYDPETVRRACQNYIAATGITNLGWSNASGVARPALINILNGRTKRPQAETLAKLANGVGLTIDGLLKYADGIPASDAPEQEAPEGADVGDGDMTTESIVVHLLKSILAGQDKLKEEGKKNTDQLIDQGRRIESAVLELADAIRGSAQKPLEIQLRGDEERKRRRPM